MTPRPYDDWFPYELDGQWRLAEARASIVEARRVVDEWVELRHGMSPDPQLGVSFARFGRHFCVLQETLVLMLDAIEAKLPAVGGQISAAEAYQAARATQRRVGKVRQTFRWYTGKYEQRESKEFRGVLFAADEIVRSCWETAFLRCNKTPPTAPLCYLDESFDAVATPRRSRPAGLPAGDEVIGSFIAKLPVPTISLPLTCLDQPWFLVVIAHEVGHHIQFDLDPLLESAAAAAVRDAAVEEFASDWSRWSVEVFADMWAVLMTGGAAGWIIAQLVAAGAAKIVEPIQARGLYPPPLVRIALIGEFGHRLGINAPGPTADEVISLLADSNFAEVDTELLEQHRRLLTAVGSVADAMLGLRAGDVGVLDVSGYDKALLGAGGTFDEWRKLLYNPDPAIRNRDREYSARTLIAALAAAARAVPADSPQRSVWRSRLCSNGLNLLPHCGTRGDMADQDSIPIDTRLLADTLLDELFEEVS